MEHDALPEVFRVDRFTVDASTVREVPGLPGMLDVDGVVARSGVQPYPEFGTNEYRPPEEVLDPESLATLKGVPLTIEHPDPDGPDKGRVTSSNVRKLAHGWVLDVRPMPDQGLVDITVRVASDEALDEIRTRRRIELSAAYRAFHDATPGTAPDGTPYTGVQRRIRYNAVALTVLARAGHVARLRLDAMKNAKLEIKGRPAVTIPVLWADALSAEAAKLGKEGNRADGLAVAEIVIEGQTLVVPKAVVDQIIAMLGGGGAPEAGPPADAAPAAAAPAGIPPDQQPRMDAAAVGKIVAAELAKVERRDAVVRKAAQVLGDVASTDEWSAASAAIVRVDSEAKADAEALADQARKGDQVAVGRLLERLDSAVRKFRETHSSGDLALGIDASRREQARTDAAPKPNKILGARDKMIERMRGAKPTTPAAAG